MALTEKPVKSPSGLTSNSSASSETTHGTDVEKTAGVSSEIQVHEHSWLSSHILRGDKSPIASERPPLTRGAIPILSLLWWGWLTPIVKRGYYRALEETDIPLCPEKQMSGRRLKRYRTKLDEYKARGGVKYMHIRAILFTLRTRLFWVTAIVSFYIAAELCVTVISRHLISEVTLIYSGKSDHGKAIGLAVGNTLISLAFQWALMWFSFKSRYFAEIVRTTMITAIYDKMVRLSPRGRQQFPASKITALITADTNRLFIAGRWTPVLFVFPFAFGGMLGLLYSYIGIATLPGVGLILVGLFVNFGLSRLITKLRRLSIPFADKRIGAIRETVENMRIIKFYGWELSFVDLISKARFREAHFLKILALVEGATDALCTSIPLFAGVLAFAVRTILNSDLDPALIFPSLTVFQLYVPLSMLFNTAITTHADAWTSVRRLNEFFEADEEDNYVLALPATSENAVEIIDASFSWEGEPEHSSAGLQAVMEEAARRQDDGTKLSQVGHGTLPAQAIADEADFEENKTDQVLERAGARKFAGLVGVNLKVKRGDLVMIVGPIGSGKTSLLSVITGEIHKATGSVAVSGEISTVLSMWSSNDTIRANICFGQPYDADLYARVVKVCNLESDFASFEARDFTEVGERGITLSGGQKARLALARCVYRGGDVILLDDVLSAVDGKVAASIFGGCIQGYLSGKTRIMATHNLKLLEHADLVVYTNGDGSVVSGTLEELLHSNQAFKTGYLQHLNADEAKDLKDALDHDSTNQPHKLEDEKEKEEEEVMNLVAAAATEEGMDMLELSRTTSIVRQLSRAPTIRGPRLMTEEKRTRGDIRFDVILSYLRAGSKIGLWFCAFIVFWQCFVGAAMSMQSVFLNFWTSDKYHRSNGLYIGMYALIVALRAIGFLCLIVSVARFCFQSSSKLHNNAVANLYRAPVSYFDSTPLGRIINRFTDDTANLDTQLYMLLRQFLFTSSMFVGSLIVIFVYIPWTILILIPLIVFGLVFFNYYRWGARELKRMNSLYRSKMFTVVTESLGGLAVICNYKRSDDYRQMLCERIDDMNISFSVTASTQQWLSIRVITVTMALVFMTIMLAIFSVFNLNSSEVGLLLSTLPSLSIGLAFALPLMAEIENQTNSVERLYELAHEIPQEAPYIIAETEPAKEWPQQGRIEFKNVSLRYRQDTPLVLNNVSLDIKPGEKVGVVGRTGAGKSTMMSALFRLTEITSGAITIDGVDVGAIGLATLRARLAIIPQEPVLFEGTIRFNLDPFGERKDSELWDALRRSGIVREAELVNGVASLEHKFHLDARVDASGTNFSLGERQLLTLARALVRRAKIIALDEATASVDLETDRMIQQTIAAEFSDCTVLSIAHRLQTIINYDRVIVMQQGEIIEQGKPFDLFHNEESEFRQMALNSGITGADF